MQIYQLNTGLVHYSDGHCALKNLFKLKLRMFKEKISFLLNMFYETIMFGRLTHTLDAAAMQGRSLFTSFTFCNTTAAVL